VFDFGCGCGREARRLLLQHDAPESYVGLDISGPMIQWCKENLKRRGFEFYHHDVWNPKYAPENSRNRYLPIAPLGKKFTLIEANSVFTHLHDDQTRFYLEQMTEMLAPRGIIRATWFLINKNCFPMMGDDLNTIFVSEADTTHAVYYDWHYLVSMSRSLGYRIAKIEWSPTLGFHNVIYLARSTEFDDLGDTMPPAARVLGF
jgi:SAM-dependent methyltransferase